MKTLWFKSEFVQPILSGKKRDTIRNQSARLPRVGDVVAFSVGPRPAFAQAIIESIEPITSKNISQDRLVGLSRCLGEIDKPLVRLTFSI